jgi:plastocyanin
VLGSLLAACGGNDSGGSTGSSGSTSTGGRSTAPTGASGGASGATASGGDAITIQNFSFEPGELAVNGKATITVTNKDSTTHTFTADDGSFDQEVPAGQSIQVQVDITQDTGFHCKIHPTMTGTLTAG